MRGIIGVCAGLAVRPGSGDRGCVICECGDLFRFGRSERSGRTCCLQYSQRQARLSFTNTPPGAKLIGFLGATDEKGVGKHKDVPNSSVAATETFIQNNTDWVTFSSSPMSKCRIPVSSLRT